MLVGTFTLAVLVALFGSSAAHVPSFELSFIALGFLAPAEAAGLRRLKTLFAKDTDHGKEKTAPPGLENKPVLANLVKSKNLKPENEKIAAETLVAINANDADAQYIDIDVTGGVLFVDPPPPDTDEFPIPDGENQEYPENVDIQESGVPKFHSKPGAAYTLYLDFDGHDWTGGAWLGSGGSADAKPYDTDGNYDSVSADELEDIGNVWAIVAEDFAPFDIDVTTEKPITLDNTVGHVLITEEKDKNGSYIRGSSDCGCGGVAYVNVFGQNANYGPYLYYSPALVFAENLYSAKNIAEAASHEFGHNLGLSHDGTATVGYYGGHGSGETDWAPIMGVGYYGNITQWSKGEYDGANQGQDDLAIIAGKIGYAVDDHTSDTALSVTGTTGFAEGIIERNDDEDTFTFTSGGGQVTVHVTTRSSRFGNLDAAFKIQRESDGAIIATEEPAGTLQASWTGSLPAGNYKIAVYGTGNEADPSVTGDQGYTDYASLGQYEVSVEGVTDATGPTSTTTPPGPTTTTSTTSSTTTTTTTGPTSNCSSFTKAKRCNGASGCKWKGGSCNDDP